MMKSETTYDKVNNLLLEYATLVVCVAEVPSNDLEIHRAKRNAVMELRDATRSIIMEMIEQKVGRACKGSVN